MSIGMGMGFMGGGGANSSDIIGWLKNSPGLTFFKDYARNQSSADADFSIGSPTITVTSARSASAPATYFNSDGVIQTMTTANVPRLTKGFYDETGWHARPGLIVESGGSQTTGRNVALQSYAFTNISWTTTNIAAVDSVADGVLNSTVSTLTATAGNGTITQAFTDASAGKYTASIFIKRKTGTGTINLRANTGNSYTDITSYVGSSWTRVQVTSTSLTNPTFDLQIVSNGDEVYVYGAQLEKTPYATTFIPTTSSVLTRASELVSYSIYGNRTADKESIFIKFTPLGSNFVNDNVQRSIIYSDTKNRAISKNSTGTTIAIYPNAQDNPGVTSSSTTSPVAGTSYIIAATMQQNAPNNYVSNYVNGSLESGYTAAAYTTPEWGTNWYLGSRDIASSGQLNGIIESVTIYSTWKEDPEINHISYILSPTTVTYRDYLFTPTTPGTSANLVSGSAGTGNVTTNSSYDANAYLWHDHYVCADVGWTKESQTCENVLLFQRNGSDAQMTIGATQPIGNLTVRTYTKSTNTMSTSPTTIWTSDTNMAFDFYATRHNGENFFRIYTVIADRATHSIGGTYLIKSTDLTATSWSSPTLVIANAMGAPANFIDTSDGNKAFAICYDINNGHEISFYKTTDNGDTFTFYSSIPGTTNNFEGEFVNEPGGTGRVIGVLRDQSQGYLVQVTSTDWGLTWSAKFNTNIGASGAGVKVTPKLKLSAGNSSYVNTYFYDRTDNRLKISGPTKFADAFAGTWAPIYLIGTSSQGNGDFFPIDYNLRRYIVSTVTNATPNSMNWWIYNDIWSWVAQ